MARQMTEFTKKRIIELIKQGLPITIVSKRLGVRKDSIRREARRAGIIPKRDPKWNLMKVYYDLQGR